MSTDRRARRLREPRGGTGRLRPEGLGEARPGEAPTGGAVGLPPGGAGAPLAGELGGAPPETLGEPPGFELALRLLLGFRVLIDELHGELARQGHPDLRPMHGFVLQAVGPSGSTAAELGRRLGVSKQAAGKIIGSLERLGYLERGTDPGDGRRKIVQLTSRAGDALQRSETIFDQLRARWAAAIGEERLRTLESGLREVTPANVWRLDVPGWFGTP
jgi:DNA-binding MarR family transcriptional regulator